MAFSGKRTKNGFKIDFSVLDANLEKLVLTIRDNEFAKKNAEERKNRRIPKKKLNVEMIKKLIKEAKEQSKKEQNVKKQDAKHFKDK